MNKEEQLSRQLKSLNIEEKASVTDMLNSLPKENQHFLLEVGSQLIKSSSVNGTWYWRQLPRIVQKLPWRELEIWLGDCVQVSRGNWECALAMLKNSTETRELLGTDVFLQAAQLGRMLMHYSVAEALWYFKNSIKLVERLGIGDWSLLLAWGARILSYSWQGTVSCFRYWPEIKGTLSEDSKQKILHWGLQVSQAIPEATQAYFQALPGFIKSYGCNTVETWVNCAEGLEKGEKAKKGLIGAYFLATPSLVGKLNQQTFSNQLSQWAAWGSRLSVQSTCLAETFFLSSPQLVKNIEWSEIEQIVQLAEAILENCLSELCAEEFLKRAFEILSQLDVRELTQWVKHGFIKSTMEKKQAYFLMKSQESREAIAFFRSGLTLEAVQKVLLLYCEGLTGRKVVIRKASELPESVQENNRLFSTLDTRRIYLPDIVKLSEDNQHNLRFYRVLLLHQVAHQEFGTLELLSKELLELSANPLLGLIFRLLEDNRVDYLAMQSYPGFVKDWRILMESYQKTVPYYAEPKQNTYPELVYLRDYLWSGDDKVDGKLQQEVAVFWDLVRANGASAGETLAAARQVLGVLEDDHPDHPDQLTLDSLENSILYALPHRGGLYFDLLLISRSIDEEEHQEHLETNLIISEFQLGLRKLLTQFLEDENNPYRLVAYYDEWDRTLNDYKKDWCRVREILLKPSTGRFVQQTLDENYGMINTLKRYFGMLRPDRFRRYPRQEDGDELDLDAVIEGMVEKQAGVSPHGGFYVKRDKRERDVAVGFLLDLSFSTEEVIKNKAKTLLDVEKESVIVMAEALEVLGDKYAIYGFNSDGRDKVTFYVVKDFEETYNWDIKQRFGGLKSHGMTRLAAAVRHATFKMEQVKAAIKILILLSDGRPFDFDYHSGSSKDYEQLYTEMDSKMALREARMRGINPFCITVDNCGQDYMHHIFGQVNYIIINDVEALPSKLTEIYKNLTT